MGLKGHFVGICSLYIYIYDTLRNYFCQSDIPKMAIIAGHPFNIGLEGKMKKNHGRVPCTFF